MPPITISTTPKVYPASGVRGAVISPRPAATRARRGNGGPRRCVGRLGGWNAEPRAAPDLLHHQHGAEDQRAADEPERPKHVAEQHDGEHNRGDNLGVGATAVTDAPTRRMPAAKAVIESRFADHGKSPRAKTIPPVEG